MEEKWIHRLRCMLMPKIILGLALVVMSGVDTQADTGAVIGTYAETSVMVADGNTVYTAWVFVDNTGLDGESTWGSQHSLFLPPYATLISGGQGVAFDKPDAGRDFFSGDPMAFEFIAGPTETTGRLVNPADMVFNSVGDLQYYKFTINPDAPTGAGNFDLGPESTLTDATGTPQTSIKLNVMFTITQIAGDLNLDGFVGIEDLSIVLGNWNTDTGIFDPPAGDSNGDGFVGIEDLNWVLSNWNTGTPPATAAVPEPSSLILLLISLLAMRNRC